MHSLKTKKRTPGGKKKPRIFFFVKIHLPRFFVRISVIWC